MSTRPPLRAALIGCGHISVRHLPAWQATPDAELVAVCDLDLSRAEERARELGIAKAYDDVEAMLDAEQLDCVDIATHDVTHTGLVTIAARRGLHALCQKPLAPSMAEARAMVELTAKAGVRFMVMEMWRHLKPVRDMKRYLDQGIIGAVYALRLLAPPRVLRRTRPIDASWAVPIERKVTLHLGDFLIEGVDGALHLDPYDAELRHVTTSGMTVLQRYEPSSPGGAGPLGQGAFNSCIADFAAGVRHDQPFESDAEDNLKTLAITLASYESVARGTAVTPDEGTGNRG